MKRYIAHIIFEAKTPLKVGSNNSDFLQDAPIQKDWNNLPMILGTSLAGILRQAYDGDTNEIFGDEESKKRDAKGSKVVISNALLLDENNKVHEELLNEKTPFLKIFDTLPIREHTAITDKGVAKDKSKFDEEVLYKGSRFRFSIELQDASKKEFKQLLQTFAKKELRIGGGSTKGFGAIDIIEIKTAEFDETNYHKYSNSLNNTTITEPFLTKKTQQHLSNFTVYELKLKPDDFFMFGSGFGDDDADMTPVYEQVVNYDKKQLSEEKLLIPASSIKGAISHRTTFYYNKNCGNTIENEKNEGVVTEIFGKAKNSKEDIDGAKGKVLFSDCYLQKSQTKVFDHVAIDRFTGGTIDGALFQEKTATYQESFTIEILLQKCVSQEAKKAFEESLKDVARGMLALGGATTKGHGVFSGEVLKDGEAI